MLFLRRAAVVGFVLVVAACGRPPPGPPRLDLAPANFAALPGWPDDRHDEAIAAFLRSCERFAPLPDDRLVGFDGFAGVIADWREPCAAAARIAPGDGAAARAFFEDRFLPFAASDRGEREGLFTGYYEPLLAGARRRDARYTVPLYARPDDLVAVDLGLFSTDLKGRRIAGRVVDGVLKPYPSRAEIDAGLLAGRVPVIAWVDDPVDAFFLQVQGSGRVRLPDGKLMRLGYAASNGRAYVSIGRYLVERGALTRDAVSLPAIRAWLAAHPDDAAAVLGVNPSYVFFRELDGDGPLGSQGAVLTPGRSLAVDRRFIPLGVPVWLDIATPAADPAAPDRRLRRLVVAQDTGGAITGPLRGDFFWGFGPEAGAIAGRMKHPGRLYLLLPRAVARRIVAAGG
ncbi:MAG: murein transglycosylase A [Alphaproteobacteria bacterium]